MVKFSKTAKPANPVVEPVVESKKVERHPLFKNGKQVKLIDVCRAFANSGKVTITVENVTKFCDSGAKPCVPSTQRYAKYFEYLKTANVKESDLSYAKWWEQFGKTGFSKKESQETVESAMADFLKTF